MQDTYIDNYTLCYGMVRSQDINHDFMLSFLPMSHDPSVYFELFCHEFLLSINIWFILPMLSYSKAYSSLTTPASGAGWLSGKFGAFCLEGQRLESHSSRHLFYGPWASPSLAVEWVTWRTALRGCLAVKFDSCNNLLSPVHTMFVIHAVSVTILKY